MSEEHQGGEIDTSSLIGLNDDPGAELVTLPEGTQVKPIAKEPCDSHNFAISDYWCIEGWNTWYHCERCHRVFHADEQMMNAARQTRRISFPQEKDETLVRITKDVRRVMGDKPSAQIISEILSRYEPIDTKPSARDTQFVGFAKLLAEDAAKMPQKAREPIEEMNKRFQLLIAQRAYDLTQHAVGYTLEYLHECGIELSSRMDKRILPSIPDLNDWAKWGYKVQEK